MRGNVDQGFSLIEALMMLGILSVVATGMWGTLFHGNRGMRSISSLNEINANSSHILTLLQKPDLCAQSLRSQNGPARFDVNAPLFVHQETLSAGGAPLVTRIQSGNQMLAQVGAPSSTGYTAESISLARSDVATPLGAGAHLTTATLRIRYKNRGIAGESGLGAPSVERNFGLRLTTNAQNQITACSSYDPQFAQGACEAIGGQWDPTVPAGHPKCLLNRFAVAETTSIQGALLARLSNWGGIGLASQGPLFSEAYAKVRNNGHTQGMQILVSSDQANAAPAVLFERSAGAVDQFLPTSPGMILGKIGAHGFVQGTQWSTNQTAMMLMRAVGSAWDASSQATQIELYTTPESSVDHHPDPALVVRSDGALQLKRSAGSEPMAAGQVLVSQDSDGTARWSGLKSTSSSVYFHTTSSSCKPQAGYKITTSNFLDGSTGQPIGGPHHSVNLHQELVAEGKIPAGAKLLFCSVGTYRHDLGKPEINENNGGGANCSVTQDPNGSWILNAGSWNGKGDSNTPLGLPPGTTTTSGVTLPNPGIEGTCVSCRANCMFL